MTWGFIWLMLVLKIPIVGLLLIVWWAIRQSVDPSDDAMAPVSAPPHPREPHRPARPRGPHGDAMPPPPPRVRGTVAIGREHADR